MQQTQPLPLDCPSGQVVDGSPSLPVLFFLLVPKEHTLPGYLRSLLCFHLRSQTYPPQARKCGWGTVGKGGSLTIGIHYPNTLADLLFYCPGTDNIFGKRSAQPENLQSVSSCPKVMGQIFSLPECLCNSYQTPSDTTLLHLSK